MQTRWEILERADGRVLAIEIKLGVQVGDVETVNCIRSRIALAVTCWMSRW